MTFGSVFGRTFSPTFQPKSQAVAGTYADKIVNIFGANILSYLTLSDASGTTAQDYYSTDNDGVYSNTGITLGETGIGDGLTSTKFTTGAFVDWYGGIQDVFNGSEGTFNVWAKAADADIWTDGANHYVVFMRYNSSNSIGVSKTASNGRLEYNYMAGGTQEQYRLEGNSTTDWMMITITWSKSNERVLCYFNGVKKSTKTALGDWTGSLNYNYAVVGAYTNVGANAWKGWLAHALLLDREATEPEVSSLYSLI